jgi:hypothetical protein
MSCRAKILDCDVPVGLRMQVDQVDDRTSPCRSCRTSLRGSRGHLNERPPKRASDQLSRTIDTSENITHANCLNLNFSSKMLYK